MKLTVKDVLAVLIALLALGGVVVMWNAEAGGIPEAVTGAQDVVAYYQQAILPGLKQYSMALGAMFVAAGVAYILVGRQEEIATRPDKE